MAEDEEIVLGEVQQDLFEKISTTKNNYFIQGQAGTGKSTFVQYVKANIDKEVVVACPTAVAAMNIGGATMHSLFQIPPKDFLILDNLELKKKPAQILRKAELLIIDEISMVRPDMLDAIDFLAKKARESLAPFGGLQVLLIGDLCQLPPVIRYSVYDIFIREYGFRDAYFFDAKSFQAAGFEFVEFGQVYRQREDDLLEYLRNIREYKNLVRTIDFFNSAKILDEKVLGTAVTITPRKNVAEDINQRRLASISAAAKSYSCETNGVFEEKDFPAPKVLVLKVGALVMFNKNNAPLWVNGASGVVESLENDVIQVRLLSNGRVVSVRKEEWQKFEYEFDSGSGKIVEKEIGTFRQFPLQLGYALTIHKAQGKTLDKVIVDLDEGGAFAHGQMYVALSRTRRLSDMHIKNRIDGTDIILSQRVIEFLKSA